jgi:uncharacterized protein YecT (DUF1311 family)
MKTFHAIVLAFLLIVPPAFCADFTECFQKNTLEMGYCFGDIQNATENDLRNEEESIKLQISQLTLTPKGESENNELKKQTLASFVEAQKSWRTYRDNDCKFIYNANQYGSMRSMFQQQCIIMRTEERIISLRNWQNWKY